MNKIELIKIRQAVLKAVINLDADIEKDLKRVLESGDKEFIRLYAEVKISELNIRINTIKDLLELMDEEVIDADIASVLEVKAILNKNILIRDELMKEVI